MIKDKEKYTMVKERQGEDVVVITFTKKERQCDGCLCMKKAKDIRIVKYPIIHRDMGRLIMDKRICIDCYDDYREIMDCLKYN